MSSNIGQNYPYSSETEAERLAAVETATAARDGLGGEIRAGSVPLDAQERWWTWCCRRKGCGGVVHAAGYARDHRAVFVVCDRCGSTSLR